MVQKLKIKKACFSGFAHFVHECQRSETGEKDQWHLLINRNQACGISNNKIFASIVVVIKGLIRYVGWMDGK